MPAPKVGDTLHFEFTLDADAVNIAEQYHVRADFENAVGSESRTGTGNDLRRRRRAIRW